MLLALVVIGILVSLVRHLWIALFLIGLLWYFLFSKKEKTSYVGFVPKQVLSMDYLYCLLGYGSLA